MVAGPYTFGKTSFAMVHGKPISSRFVATFKYDHHHPFFNNNNNAAL